MSDDGRDRLDRELDAVLHALVGGEGPADLRSRVLGRLARPAPAVPWPAWAAAAAALALASIVGWWAGRRPAPHSSPPVAERPRSSPSPRVAGTAIPEASPPPVVARVAGTALAPRRPAAAVTSAEDAPMLPPLPVPAPITVAGLEPPSVELDPIDVKPLVVPDLAVTPLPGSGEPEHERKD